jgi:hypothetical protein
VGREAAKETGVNTEIQIIVPQQADETNPLDHALVTLTEAIAQIDPDAIAHGCLGGEFGYGAKYENDVFWMIPDYQDAECNCGSNERGEAWHAANPHAATCYQVVLRVLEAKWDRDNHYQELNDASACDIFLINGELFTGTCEQAMREHFARGGMFESKRSDVAEAAHKAWCKLSDSRRKAHKTLAIKLHKEMNLKWGDGHGWGWRCTCGVDALATEWFARAENQHATRCAIAVPNFWHKPSGFEVRWYKWIGRDMETNEIKIDIGTVFNECLASLPHE